MELVYNTSHLEQHRARFAYGNTPSAAEKGWSKLNLVCLLSSLRRRRTESIKCLHVALPQLDSPVLDLFLPLSRPFGFFWHKASKTCWADQRVLLMSPYRISWSPYTSKWPLLFFILHTLADCSLHTQATHTVLFVWFLELTPGTGHFKYIRLRAEVFAHRQILSSDSPTGTFERQRLHFLHSDFFNAPI